MEAAAAGRCATAGETTHPITSILDELKGAQSFATPVPSLPSTAHFVASVHVVFQCTVCCFPQVFVARTPPARPTAKTSGLSRLLRENPAAENMYSEYAQWVRTSSGQLSWARLG
jgi:hypothetical protein